MYVWHQPIIRFEVSRSKLPMKGLRLRKPSLASALEGKRGNVSRQTYEQSRSSTESLKRDHGLCKTDVAEGEREERWWWADKETKRSNDEDRWQSAERKKSTDGGQRVNC